MKLDQQERWAYGLLLAMALIVAVMLVMSCTDLPPEPAVDDAVVQLDVKGKDKGCRGGGRFACPTPVWASGALAWGDVRAMGDSIVVQPGDTLIAFNVYRLANGKHYHAQPAFAFQVEYDPRGWVCRLAGGAGYAIHEPPDATGTELDGVYRGGYAFRFVAGATLQVQPAVGLLPPVCE